ncbi:hypothetical protein Ahy_B10g102493 [Arachis hypogaea]|uniref:Uncharacterized protein n=1 Tax=Arachis hypogaea TaxID=3818 RepID=A0A444X298_ARAHY|nr:hypothetical protein Ahy_B10g102493 [Arachis hypogaea]
MFYIRHIGSNFLRRFNAPYLYKLVVNIERGEAYTPRCDEIAVEKWVLAFDGGSYGDEFGRVHKFCLKGTRNLSMIAIIRFTFYRLNKLFTQKSVEAHERICNGFISTGAMGCLRFMKCETVLYTLLILRNDIAIWSFPCRATSMSPRSCMLRQPAS